MQVRARLTAIYLSTATRNTGVLSLFCGQHHTLPDLLLRVLHNQQVYHQNFASAVCITVGMGWNGCHSCFLPSFTKISTPSSVCPLALLLKEPACHCSVQEQLPQLLYSLVAQRLLPVPAQIEVKAVCSAIKSDAENAIPSD